MQLKELIGDSCFESLALNQSDLTTVCEYKWLTVPYAEK